MNSLPQLRQLYSASSRNEYALHYEQSSGLPIPADYLLAPENQVFGIFRNQRLIGGFILGSCLSLRTIQVFAAAQDQAAIDARAGTSSNRTEITCFWIAANVRRDVIANRFTWLAMIYAIARYANATLVFGTCSRGLARLYATSQYVELLNQDRLNGKPVFIFKGLKRHAVIGILNILAYKSSWKFNPLRLLRRSRKMGLASLLQEL